MKRLFSLIFTIIILFGLCSCTDKSDKKESDTTSIDITEQDCYIHISIDSLGNDIYAPGENVKWGYRYGPTLITSGDNSIDAFFASPGYSGEWDWITYKHSDDGGISWTNEKKVLGPTPGGEDAYSTCDPGVIKIGDYYYIGYTSTQNEDGIQNNVYIARSQNIDGPYEKWNGRGWGGKPTPIIEFTDDVSSAWGCGEPSFVLIGDTLYIYYTWKSVDSSGLTNQTRLSIATIDGDNWPKSIQYKGIAINYPDYECDSADIKYIDEYDMFIAVNCGGRLTEDSYISFWQSNDGTDFVKSTECKSNTEAYAHNVGISALNNGHIDLDSKVYISYAFGKNWGFWATKLAPITISMENNKQEDDTGENYKSSLPRSSANKNAIAITDNERKYVLSVGETDSITLYSINGDFQSTDIANTDAVYSDYDTDIIDISDGTISAKSLGNTFVTITYDDFQTEIYVVVSK